jgi:hypothetical protein
MSQSPPKKPTPDMAIIKAARQDALAGRGGTIDTQLRNLRKFESASRKAMKRDKRPVKVMR